MTFASTCDWTLLRSLLLALVAWPVCHGVECGLKASPRPGVWLALLVSPFLFPELLLGYLLAPLVVTRPWAAELTCDAILLARSIPIGVMALWIAPSSALSPAALHVRRLKLQTWRDRWELAACYWHGPIRRGLPACGLMFLVTFQEFEAAALLNTVSWTDQLFVEHATRGQSLADSVCFLVRPVAMQLVMLALVGWSLWPLRSNLDDAAAVEHDRPISERARRAAELASLLLCVLGTVLPLGFLMRELFGGWNWLVTQPRAVMNLFTEITTAGLVALVAGLAAWNLSDSDRLRSRLRFAALLPGLCGNLTVALAVLWIVTHSPLRQLSRTPTAWVIALIIWLFPRAVLMRWWLARRAEPAAMHLVELLRQSPDAAQARTARRWHWRWRIEPQIAAVGVLCYWAYLDLTSAALLAPPGMVSIVVHLYNFMHFGHSAALTIQAVIVMLLPALLWVTLMAAARAVACRDGIQS